MKKCVKCNREIQDDVNYCSSCGVENLDYPKPAGFWVRVAAYLIDFLVFIPIIILSFINLFLIKSFIFLIIIAIPGFIYKPFMESYFGATLGKMACGLKVIDENGNKLTLGQAYVRFFPFGLAALAAIVSSYMFFSLPGFKTASSLTELAQLQQGTAMKPLDLLTNLFVWVDCIMIAFTYRKRALHDMMASSFCVYK